MAEVEIEVAAGHHRQIAIHPQMAGTIRRQRATIQDGRAAHRAVSAQLAAVIHRDGAADLSGHAQRGVDDFRRSGEAGAATGQDRGATEHIDRAIAADRIVEEIITAGVVKVERPLMGKHDRTCDAAGRPCRCACIRADGQRAADTEIPDIDRARLGEATITYRERAERLRTDSQCPCIEHRACAIDLHATGCDA